MSKIINTNHPPPQGYELFSGVIDTLGRRWRLAAWPIKGGTIAYFNSLSDYLRWTQQVEEVRQLASGKMSRRERMWNAKITGEIPGDLADRMLERFR